MVSLRHTIELNLPQVPYTSFTFNSIWTFLKPVAETLSLNNRGKGEEWQDSLLDYKTKESNQHQTKTKRKTIKVLLENQYLYSDRVLLLQYVDDLLIAAVGLIPCLKNKGRLSVWVLPGHSTPSKGHRGPARDTGSRRRGQGGSPACRGRYKAVRANSLDDQQEALQGYTKDSQPFLLDAPVHSLQPGDSVLIRTWKDEPLHEKRKGPHTVLLVSHMAAKVKGHKNWIHHSQLKAVHTPEQWTVQPAEKTASNDLGLKLLFKRQ
nr:uncharacterized protein LOC122174649 [Chrysemys picta bellii]